jgi:hypothetical protein
MKKNIVEQVKLKNSQATGKQRLPSIVERVMMQNSETPRQSLKFNPSIYEMKETPPSVPLPNESEFTEPVPNARIHADETDNSSVISEIKNKTIVEDLGTFPEFSHLITHTYWGPMTQNSTTLDIIAVYLKGQKILYIDSKNYCEQKLNYLMMPTIFITAVCSIISMVLKDTEFGSILVSSLAGFSTFLLSIISYLGLDAKAQAHKTSAYQFDKAQTMCEFFSGKVLLIKDPDVDKKVQDFVTQVEKKVAEIKDVNQFIIPEVIRYRYPKIYSVNVFSEIKRYKNREKILRNELHYIFQKIDHLANANEPIPEDLITIKEHKLKEILEYQDEYFKLDDEFEHEVNEYINLQRSKAGCCGRKNKIISSYIHTPKSRTPVPATPVMIPIAPIQIAPTVPVGTTKASEKLAAFSAASKVPK